VAGRYGADEGGTAQRALDIAERLVQQRGFNSFSYAHVATELGITKAALHYHFANKTDLGEALISRYSARFAQALATIESDVATAAGKLAGYAELYQKVLRERRMCLCGMLAAEYQTLPQPMRDAVIGFFDRNESWLERVLEEGRSDRSLRFAGSAQDTARMIVSGLEGAMLVARPYGDVTRFEAAAESLIASVRAPHGGLPGVPSGDGEVGHPDHD
jgi:TetR/AcrR family transcriptional repressor of nem operon